MTENGFERRVSTGRHFIGGSFVDASGGGSDVVVEKATGLPLGRAAVGGASDVDLAVESAKQARSAWANSLYPVRTGVLRSAAALLEEHSDRWIDMIVRETGSIAAKAEYEVWAATNYLYQAAELAAQMGGDLLPSAMPDKLNIVQRVPLGTIGVITPWNFPLVLSMYTVAPALAVGNTVVLKPAPDTPISGGQMIAELFADAGIPPGVLNVVTGDGAEVGERLVRHPDVQMIHFTGSTAVGRRINVLAAETCKRVSLEMGGNNALVVLDDADADVAAMVGAFAAFNYQGQTCITAGRHIVMRAVAHDYIDSLQARARAIVVGDPTDPTVGLGPLINERQRDRAIGILERSIKSGAKLIEGGTCEGLFFRPTVLGDVSPDSPAFVEELFAPIAPITIVDSEAEALELTNQTEYGLVNSVFTGDPMRGLAFAEGVHSGMVHVNDVTTLVEPNVPFGGVGLSGVGRPTGGEANLEHFTERKWISIHRGQPEYPF